MQATRLQKISICFKIAIFTLFYSLRIIFLALINKYPRAKINFFIHKWAVKLLRSVKADYAIFNPYGVTFKPNQRYILMSNHLSHFDIPLIYVAFPKSSIRMIAKKELFKVPIWGRAMKKSEFFTLDREDKKQAKQVLQLAEKKMAEGIMPWIAPEGTRSKDGKLQHFKKGGFILALETKAIIVPIGIRGSEKILPAKTLNFGIGEHVEVHIAKPITTEGRSVKELRLLMQEVEESIKGCIAIKMPNSGTLNTFAETDKGKNVVKVKSVREIFKKAEK